jgi:hypothetical protein
MTYFFTILLLFTGCSMKQWYPTLGATAAGATGAAFGGGPLLVGLAAGGGAMAGEVARGNAEVKEAKDTLRAITEGDVSAIVQKGLKSHQSGFEEFTSTIKKILMVAACFLGLYLMVPIFVARQCSKTEAEKLTRVPFATKTTGRNK